MIVGILLTGGIGIALVVIGMLLWKKQAISLLHDYHYQNVAASDKQAFCTLSGIGVLIIGIGLVLSAVLLGITDSVLGFVPFAVGLAGGLSLLVCAGRRYNTPRSR